MLYHAAMVNIAYIYFFYGLSLVVMGIAVLLYFMQFRKTKLARHIWWLGAFGITHGLSEVTVMFRTFKYLMGIPVASLTTDFAGEVGLMLISFIFLSQFGVRVISTRSRRLRWFGYILLGLGGSLLITLVLSNVLPNNEEVVWLEAIERLSRYLIFFPGVILASIGFPLQKNDLERFGVAGAKEMLYGVSISFVLYGIAEGLLVSRSGLFPPGELLPYSMSIAPVLILRSLAGIGMAYFTIRVIGALNHEYIRSLEVVERNLALSQEREAISRDLHDGTIQSLYAIGLQMKETAYLTQESPGQAKLVLENMIDRLDGVIRDIRLFIQDLRLPQGQKSTLIQMVKSQLGQFSYLTRIAVELSTPGSELTDKVTPEQANHLYYIIQEALTNVAKHADATRVNVDLAALDHQLTLSIVDDGSGMMKKSDDTSPLSGYGLLNIRSRVETLGGRCAWESLQGFGTRLTVVLPIRRDGLPRLRPDRGEPPAGGKI